MSNYYNPIPVAPNTWWVGRRLADTIFIANPFLRLFPYIDRDGQEQVFSLLIDPGSKYDLGTVRAKVQSLIGNMKNLSAIFINHQDPDVCSGTKLLMERYSPNAQLICSEETWNQIQHLGLPEERFLSVDMFPTGYKPTPYHTMLPIPTPFCHFSGAVMLYDTETKVLFSGDLFGSLTDREAQGMESDNTDWTGMRAFHQMYMPTNTALRHAIQQIREKASDLEVIASQHGRWMKDRWVNYFVDKLYQLPVGLDLLEETSEDILHAWNQVLRRLFEISMDYLGTGAKQKLQAAQELQSALEWPEESHLPQIKTRGKWVVERAIVYLSKALPSLGQNILQFEAVNAAEQLGLPTPMIQLAEGETEMHTDEMNTPSIEEHITEPIEPISE